MDEQSEHVLSMLKITLAILFVFHLAMIAVVFVIAWSREAGTYAATVGWPWLSPGGTSGVPLAPDACACSPRPSDRKRVDDGQDARLPSPHQPQVIAWPSQDGAPSRLRQDAEQPLAVPSIYPSIPRFANAFRERAAASGMTPEDAVDPAWASLCRGA